MTLREVSASPARSNRLARLWGACWLVASIVALASPASARPEFPGILQTTLETDCAPPCLICHTTPVPTDSETATQPFVNDVIATGSIAEAQLGNTILLLEKQVCANEDTCTGGMCTAPCDADGDGMPDVEELRNGRNPNNSSTLPCPEYGCFARVAPTRSKRQLDGTAALVALAVALVLVGRWRRR